MVNEADFKKKYANLNNNQLLDLLYQKELENQQLIETNNNLRRRYFSHTQSEHVSFEQLSLFNEAEDIVDTATIEELIEPVEIVKKKSGKKRKIKNIKVVEEHRYPDSTICETCGSQMRELKPEVKEYMVYKRPQYYVKRVINHVFVCQKCSNETDTLVTKKNDLSDLPNRIIEGSVVTSSVIAAIAYQKFVMGLPYYRQAKDLQTNGLNITRQNLCSWVIKAGELYLGPVFNRMRLDSQQLDSIHMDETTLNCLEVKNKSQCYEWLLMSGKYEEKQMALYYFNKTREHKFVNAMLDEKFKGLLHSDGYQAYAEYPFARLHVGCWAHARRYVFEAIEATGDVWKKYKKADKAEKKRIVENSPRLKNSLELLSQIDKLFRIEKEIQEALVSTDEIFEIRQKKSKPLLPKILAKAEAINKDFAPQGKLGKAVKYIQNQWEPLCNYVEDGKAEISNNLAEREGIKPFVIARKNFMFADTINGANVSSYYFSLLLSAKMNHLNPELYIEYVLDQLSTYGLRDEVIESVLPYSKNIPDHIRIKTERI